MSACIVFRREDEIVGNPPGGEGNTGPAMRKSVDDSPVFRDLDGMMQWYNDTASPQLDAARARGERRGQDSGIGRGRTHVGEVSLWSPDRAEAQLVGPNPTFKIVPVVVSAARVLVVTEEHDAEFGTAS
jgi:hypothetical protein